MSNSDKIRGMRQSMRPGTVAANLDSKSRQGKQTDLRSLATALKPHLGLSGAKPGSSTTGSSAKPTLADGHIFVGNAANVATDTAVAGDVTIDDTGVTTIGANKVTEGKIGLSDVTTDNVSITKHGFAPKAPNDSSKFLDGTGAYSTPAGGVTTTGSPASGNLAKFSGPTSITNGDLSGDVTTSGTLAATLAASGVSAATYGDSTHVAQIAVDAKGRVTSATSVAIAASGTVTTTGSPASGNLTKFSGSTSITNGDLSGDVTTSGALATTIKTNIALPGSPTTTTQSTGDNSTKVATTAYVTTAIANAVAAVNPAVAVDVATTSAANTSGLTYNNGVSGVGATLTGTINTALTVDGVTFNTLGQRLLVKNDTQSPSGAFNGVYSVTQLQTAILPPVLTRALDYDMASDINNTGAIPVKSGTVNALTSWLLTSLVTTVGTDPLTYVQFSFAALSAANPTATASDTAVNGTATTYMRSDAAPAVQLGSNSQFGLAKGDGTTVSISAGVASVIGSGVTGTGSDVDFDLMFFGGGTDGDVTLSSGTTNLSKDAFYHNLTISGGKLNTNGWRVYVQGTLDLTNAPAGAFVSISSLGTSINGGNVGSGVLGSNGGSGGGPATQVNTLGTGNGGGTGANGVTGAGAQAAAISAGGNQLPNTAGAGGKGGSVGATAGGASRGGATGSFAVSDVRKLTDQLYVIQNTTVQYIKGGPAAPGGSSGAGDGTGTGGGGGGGAASAGVIWIAARTIARATATTAAKALNADGGAGGNGGTGTGGTNRGGGGGGAGAPGGWLYVIYRFLTGSAAANMLSAAGGNGGNAGNGTGTGIGGDGGAAGSRGRIDLYCLANGSWTHSEADTTTVAGTAGSGATGGTGGTANTQFQSL